MNSNLKIKFYIFYAVFLYSKSFTMYKKKFKINVNIYSQLNYNLRLLYKDQMSKLLNS